MQTYATMTSDIAIEAEHDPVSFEDFKEDGHPRAVITLRGSNGVPRPFLTETMNEMIDRGIMTNPFTRQRFTDLTVRRAKLYKRALQEFPDYKISELDTDDLFKRWISTYSDDHGMPQEEVDQEEVDKVRLEAECFLQAEDLTTLFSVYDGTGSMNNRTRAISDLSGNDYARNNQLDWILRKCSVRDTQYSKAYAITHKVGNITSHDLIIHRIGEGFYYKANGIERGESADNAITGYASVHPTIIDLLKMFL